MKSNLKHKWFILAVTVISIVGLAAPLPGLAEITPDGGGGGGSSTPATTPASNGTTPCADQGSCADCNTTASSPSGCICITPDTAAGDLVNTKTGCECTTENATCVKSVPPCTEKGCDFIDQYINPAIKLVSALVGIVVVISIIIGGIQYTTSGGDPQKAAAAKSRITKTIIALLAYFFLFALLQFLIPGGIVNR